MADSSLLRGDWMGLMDATKTQQPTFGELFPQSICDCQGLPCDGCDRERAIRQRGIAYITELLAELSRVRAELNHEVYLGDKRKEEHRREKDALESALAGATGRITAIKTAYKFYRNRLTGEAQQILWDAIEAAGGAGEGGGRE
jgi:hypothetical protein